MWTGFVFICQRLDLGEEEIAYIDFILDDVLFSKVGIAP